MEEYTLVYSTLYSILVYSILYYIYLCTIFPQKSRGGWVSLHLIKLRFWILWEWLGTNSDPPKCLGETFNAGTQNSDLCTLTDADEQGERALRLCLCSSASVSLQRSEFRVPALSAAPGQLGKGAGLEYPFLTWLLLGTLWESLSRGGSGGFRGCVGTEDGEQRDLYLTSGLYTPALWCGIPCLTGHM